MRANERYLAHSATIARERRRFLTDLDDQQPKISPLAQEALNASPDAVLVTDVSFSILSINERAPSAIRMAEHGLIGLRLDRLIAQRDRERFTTLVSRAINHPGEGSATIPGEVLILRGDDTTFPAEIGVNPIRHDDAVLIVFSIRDISRHRRIENDLRTSQLLLAEAQRVARLGSWRWDIADNKVAPPARRRLMGTGP